VGVDKAETPETGRRDAIMVKRRDEEVTVVTDDDMGHLARAVEEDAQLAMEGEG